MQRPTRGASRHATEMQLPSRQYGYPGSPRNADVDPDSDIDSNGKGDEDSEAEPDSYVGADRDTNAWTDEHTDRGADEYANCDTDEYANCDTDEYANCDTDARTHEHTDGDADEHADRYTDDATDQHADAGPMRRRGVHCQRSVSHRRDVRSKDRRMLQSRGTRRNELRRQRRLYPERCLSGRGVHRIESSSMRSLGSVPRRRNLRQRERRVLRSRGTRRNELQRTERVWELLGRAVHRRELQLGLRRLQWQPLRRLRGEHRHGPEQLRKLQHLLWWPLL